MALSSSTTKIFDFIFLGQSPCFLVSIAMAVPILNVQGKTTNLALMAGFVCTAVHTCRSVGLHLWTQDRSLFLKRKATNWRSRRTDEMDRSAISELLFGWLNRFIGFGLWRWRRFVSSWFIVLAYFIHNLEFGPELLIVTELHVVAAL